MHFIWLILGIGLMGLTIRRIEINYRKRQKKTQQENHFRDWKIDVMRQLKALKTYDAEGYVRETQEAVVAFNQRIDEGIEQVLAMTNREGEIEVQNLLKEGDAFKERMKKAHQQIEELLQELETYLKEVTAFLDNTHFYPPQFALDNNKLSGMIVEIKDRRYTNPFLRTDHYHTFGIELHRQVEVFQREHQEVTRLIEEIEQKWDDYSDEKRQDVLQKKQQLFLSLHKGEIEEVASQKKELVAVLG